MERKEESRPLRHISEDLSKMGGTRPESLPPKDTGKASRGGKVNGENFRCRICRDFGMVYPVGQDGKVDYSRLVPCSCIREEIEKKRAAALLRFCELPAGTDHMTFANFKVRLGLREAYLYALGLARGGEPTWLTLMAGTGRGKTHLAIAIVRCWLARGIPAKYVHVPLLFEDLRRGFRESGDMSYEARFDRIMKVPLLLMDDLGTENSTPWVQEKLEIIFDYRLMNNLALVVTTNTPFDELPFRIASRLERLPGARVVNIEVEEYGVSDAIS